MLSRSEKAAMKKEAILSMVTGWLLRLPRRTSKCSSSSRTGSLDHWLKRRRARPCDCGRYASKSSAVGGWPAPLHFAALCAFCIWRCKNSKDAPPLSRASASCWSIRRPLSELWQTEFGTSEAIIANKKVWLHYERILARANKMLGFLKRQCRDFSVLAVFDLYNALVWCQ